MAIPVGEAAVANGEPVAPVKVASPLFSRTLTVASVWFTTARSGLLSPFKSPAAIATGPLPTPGEIGEPVASVNAPSPLPRRMVTLSVAWFTMARSWFPSELKSFMTMATGPRSAAVTGVNVNCFCAVKGVALESVTVTVKVKLAPAAAVVGVPVISPALAFRLRPVGSEPDAILQVNGAVPPRSEEHTSELQSRVDLVCRLLLEKKKQHRPTLS